MPEDTWTTVTTARTVTLTGTTAGNLLVLAFMVNGATANSTRTSSVIVSVLKPDATGLGVQAQFKIFRDDVGNLTAAATNIGGGPKTAVFTTDGAGGYYRSSTAIFH